MPWAARWRYGRAAWPDAHGRGAPDVPRHARRGLRRGRRGGRGRGGRSLLLRPHLASSANRSGRRWRPFPSSVHWRPCSARPAAPGTGPFSAPWWPGSDWSPTRVLAAQFLALESLAPGRVIAGLGTGDKLSEEENRAYGIPFPPAAERRAEMVELGRQLVRAGLPVWMAGGVAGRTEEARAAGAALNVWDADARARGRAGGGPTAWRSPGPARRPAALAAAEREGPASARGRRDVGGLRLARRRRGAGRSGHARGESPGSGGARPGPRLPRWSSAASTGCRPTCSPPSTTSRQRRGGADATSSTSGSGTRTCPRPTWRWTSWPRPPGTRATTGTPPRGHPEAAQRHHATSTSASST